MSPAPPATRHVGLLLYDEVQLLDVSGPLDVFATANQLNGRPAYECLTLAPDGATCVSESGLRMLPDCSLDAAPPLDTLLIPGGEGSRRLDQDPSLLAWIGGGIIITALIIRLLVLRRQKLIALRQLR